MVEAIIRMRTISYLLSWLGEFVTWVELLPLPQPTA
jgi:hypothetical protein